MFKVHILGTSSATPAYQRFTSAQVVNYNDRYYLIDCGEGTQMQMKRYRVKASRLDAIFISHIHGDHIFGLPGLVSTMSIMERPRPLPIFGPRALKTILDSLLELTDTYLKYELQFHAMEDFQPGDVIYSTDRMEVVALPLKHRTFCRGFLFREVNKRRRFDFYKAKGLDIPKEYFHLLKQENDVTLPDGRIVRCDEVLLPREPALSYAYCSDTCYHEPLVPFVKGASVMYHEATFLHNLKGRAEETYHSTALEAGRIAALAEVKKLLIGHYSARYRDLKPLLEEAQTAFEATELAAEGKVIDLKKDV